MVSRIGGNLPGFVARLVGEGIGVTEGRRLARTAVEAGGGGMRFRNDTFSRVYESVTRDFASRGDVMSRDWGRLPGDDELVPWQTRRVEGFATKVRIQVREVGLPGVMERESLITSHDPHRPLDALQAALDRYQPETEPEGHYAEQTVLGGYVVQTYRMEPLE